MRHYDYKRLVTMILGYRFVDAPITADVIFSALDYEESRRTDDNMGYLMKHIRPLLKAKGNDLDRIRGTNTWRLIPYKLNQDVQDAPKSHNRDFPSIIPAIKQDIISNSPIDGLSALIAGIENNWDDLLSFIDLADKAGFDVKFKITSVVKR